MARQNEDLLPLFARIVPLLRRYAPPLVPRADFESKYELWSERPLVVDGRSRKEIFFASLIVQSSYVGFYFMPVYSDPEVSAFFGPDLLKLLKGKSCFHIKKLDENLLEQIDTALGAGFVLYQSRGWIDPDALPRSE